MLTEKIALTLAQIAREDVKSRRVKLYDYKNRGPMLYDRMKKLTPMPPARPFLYNTLRMIYTGFYTLFFVYQDF